MRNISHLWQADHRGFLKSEDAFLALVDAFFPVASGHFPRGRGHDCAELENLPGALALSTDMFLEGAHFSPLYFTPAEAGAKALTAAVSDLAAAGAMPLGFSLGLAMPDNIPVRTLEDMLRGMAEKAREYGIVLTGGDAARSASLGFSLCVWGSSRHGEGHFLRRGGAVPGDLVFMVGEAGLARTGLYFLQALGRGAVRDWPQSVAAHLAPRALVEEGGRIAALACALGGKARETAARVSLMDVSDGLARDLPRLLGKAGMELDLSGLRFPDELHTAAAVLGLEAEDIFLAGGEDYALLGTCPDELALRLAAALPGARFLGRVTGRGRIVRKDGKPMPGGFDHFASAKPPAKGEAPHAAAERGKNAHASALCRKTRFTQVGDATDALIRLGGQACESGLMAGFNGNVSCRLNLGGEDGECCIITRSGAAKGRLGSADFIALALPGGGELPGLLPEAPAGASSESPLHLEIYRNCPESAVILHVHPPKLLALSLAVAEEDLLRLPLPEAERYRAALAIVPFFEPGSAALARAVGEAARTHRAVWMQRHGLVAHGPDMTAALALCEELEQLAAVQAMRLLLT